MLHHVDGEQLMIKCGQGRAQSDPQSKQSSHKCRNSPRGKRTLGSTSKTKPAARVDEYQEHQKEHASAKSHVQTPTDFCITTGAVIHARIVQYKEVSHDSENARTSIPMLGEN